MVYSPIPPLCLCLEKMRGEKITINVNCKPWMLKDAPAEDFLKLTKRIQKLALELRV